MSFAESFKERPVVYVFSLIFAAFTAGLGAYGGALKAFDMKTIPESTYQDLRRLESEVRECNSAGKCGAFPKVGGAHPVALPPGSLVRFQVRVLVSKRLIDRTKDAWKIDEAWDKSCRAHILSALTDIGGEVVKVQSERAARIDYKGMKLLAQCQSERNAVVVVSNYLVESEDAGLAVHQRTVSEIKAAFSDDLI